MRANRSKARLALAVLVAFGSPAWAAPDQMTAAPAVAAMERAGAFFRDRLGVEGTYVWAYSPDGSIRDGEGGEAPQLRGWVQWPGTPAVGAAFLQIHEATGDGVWLEAARAAAQALLRTQLMSGGWSYSIATQPDDFETWCYRSRAISPKACDRIKGNPERNTTVLDDGTTQGALGFLMLFDRADGDRDPAIRKAVEFGLERLTKLQYRNGAFFPFLKDAPPGAEVQAATLASLPADWSRTWVKPEIGPYFIVNDDLPRDIGRLFLDAYRLYGRPAYLKAAVRLGDFLLASQLPEPQRGWCQQYDARLQPVWGRKFEPPSVVSRETAGNLDFLIDLFGVTQDRRYLDAASAAGAWLEAMRLPDGSWARFYELATNRPLYIDNQEGLTYADTDLLDHYAMKSEFDIVPALERLKRTVAGEPVVLPVLWSGAAVGLGPAELGDRSRDLVRSLDSEGRWIDRGRIEGSRFVDAIATLSRFVVESRDAPKAQP
ncbi:pectate lyase [Aureimonas sp. AU12]|uniref:pectate lyase n=1 Tax=Aureimonas sp. AU12 TaxID=1638161 RepID=UPI000784DD6F|nr:pectate lyase [Aureimonas sp. AU12]